MAAEQSWLRLHTAADLVTGCWVRGSEVIFVKPCVLDIRLCNFPFIATKPTKMIDPSIKSLNFDEAIHFPLVI